MSFQIRNKRTLGQTEQNLLDTDVQEFHSLGLDVGFRFQFVYAMDKYCFCLLFTYHVTMGKPGIWDFL